MQDRIGGGWKSDPSEESKQVKEYKDDIYKTRCILTKYTLGGGTFIKEISFDASLESSKEMDKIYKTLLFFGLDVKREQGEKDKFIFRTTNSFHLKKNKKPVALFVRAIGLKWPYIEAKIRETFDSDLDLPILYDKWTSKGERQPHADHLLTEYISIEKRVKLELRETKINEAPYQISLIYLNYDTCEEEVLKCQEVLEENNDNKHKVCELLEYATHEVELPDTYSESIYTFLRLTEIAAQRKVVSNKSTTSTSTTSAVTTSKVTERGEELTTVTTAIEIKHTVTNHTVTVTRPITTEGTSALFSPNKRKSEDKMGENKKPDINGP